MSDSRQERLNKIAHDIDKSKWHLKVHMKYLFALDNTADDTPEWKIAYNEANRVVKYHENKIMTLEDERELLTQVEEDYGQLMSLMQTEEGAIGLRKVVDKEKVVK